MAPRPTLDDSSNSGNLKTEPLKVIASNDALHFGARFLHFNPKFHRLNIFASEGGGLILPREFEPLLQKFKITDTNGLLLAARDNAEAFAETLKVTPGQFTAWMDALRGALRKEFPRGHDWDIVSVRLAGDCCGDDEEDRWRMPAESMVLTVKGKRWHVPSVDTGLSPDQHAANLSNVHYLVGQDGGLFARMPSAGEAKWPKLSELVLAALAKHGFALDEDPTKDRAIRACCEHNGKWFDIPLFLAEQVEGVKLLFSPEAAQKLAAAGVKSTALEKIARDGGGKSPGLGK